MAYRILVAEDDRGLNQGICLALQREEFIFDTAYTLKEAWKKYQEKNPDMVLLDVNFPDGNGFDFLRMLRKSSDIPVLVITANDMETDEVTGLMLGADDYITKPFSLMALRIRTENIWKRIKKPGMAEYVYKEAGYFFDFGNFKFKAGGQEIGLSVPEQKLLKLLLMHKGQILTREMLVENIWDCDMEYVDENALSVTVSRLRKKLMVNGMDCPISTVYGTGYVWKHMEE